MDRSKIDVYKNVSFSQSIYNYNRKKPLKSKKFIGLDVEAYRTGKWFMLCTSLGDIFKPQDFPQCFFSRKYRNNNFVAYNLKYEQSAFLQNLPLGKLKELKEKDTTEYKGYKYKIIGYKALIIRRNRNNITIYDALNFFNMSLNKASQLYLGKEKLDQDVSLYTPQYVRHHWIDISKYCIMDAVLCAKLIEKIRNRFPVNEHE